MPVDELESKTTTHHLMHSYCILPQERFESQHSGEKIQLIVRAHPVTFIPWIAISMVLFVTPIFLNAFLVNFFTIREILFLNLFWYSLTFTYIFLNVLTWVFNVGIITNERVLDIDYTQVLTKNVTGTSIVDITDVTAKTSGFIRSMFRYGDVYVQTAGREQNIEFRAVPYPDDVVSVINRLMRT